MRGTSLKADQHPPLTRWIYAAMLHLYPADFRRDYGAELTMLFIDMQRAAAGQGVLARLSLWLTILLDLASSAARERIRTMLKARTAAVVGIVLCLPLIFMLTTAVLNYEPPFVDQYLTQPDGYSPTPLARVIMVFTLLALPAALVINLLPMLRKTDRAGVTPFTLTPAHTAVGMSILVVLLGIMSRQVRFELEPFVSRLGSAAIIGEILFLLALLALPAAFLLNRLPVTRSGGSGALIFQPTSLNLIIGAAALLIILTLISIFALETTACSIGVPNCD
jgi:hypothetical protein